VPGSPITPVRLRSSNLPTPARALAIGAHPDDIEFGCGATFAKWAAAGCEIHHLVCTDGSKGTWNPDADLTALVAIRQAEQREASRALGGGGEVVFVDQVDGELRNDRSTCSEVARWIRELRPDIVVGHDPWKRYRLHPDHREAGFLTCDAVVAARDPHFFREHGLAPHRPSALLLFEADAPTHVEDVTGYGHAKVAALEAHRSQFESTMFVPGDDDPSRDAALARFRRSIHDELATVGRALGVAEAEAFALIDDL
jgi:LmbE family N-acetylglucosaminyl deacetylase